VKTNECRSTENGNSNVGEAVPKVGQKSKLQTRICYAGGKSAGGTDVMSVIEEDNLPTTPYLVDNVWMDEIMSE
jgi:hypothetical protein